MNAQPGGAAHSTEIHVSVESALAIAMQVMSDAALKGLSIQRTQTVVDYLNVVAGNPSTHDDLRNCCRNLSALWRLIDLR